MAHRKKLCKIVILGDSQYITTTNFLLNLYLELERPQSFISRSMIYLFCLYHRFVDERFTQQYRATVGADLMAKELQVDGKSVTLQVKFTPSLEKLTPFTLDLGHCWSRKIPKPR